MPKTIDTDLLTAIAKEAAFVLAALRGSQSLNPTTAADNRRELADAADDLESLLKRARLLTPWRREGGRLGVW